MCQSSNAPDTAGVAVEEFLCRHRQSLGGGWGGCQEWNNEWQRWALCQRRRQLLTDTLGLRAIEWGWFCYRYGIIISLLCIILFSSDYCWAVYFRGHSVVFKARTVHQGLSNVSLQHTSTYWCLSGSWFRRVAAVSTHSGPCMHMCTYKHTQHSEVYIKNLLTIWLEFMIIFRATRQEACSIWPSPLFHSDRNTNSYNTAAL